MNIHESMWSLFVFLTAIIFQVLGVPVNKNAETFFEDHNMEELDISWLGRRLLETTVATSEPEKSFWDKIQEFYADKNNFAMYLVLPIIVIVYGGCCLIYCIAKCRRYLKRKKDKQLLKNEERDDEDVDDKERNNNVTKQLDENPRRNQPLNLQSIDSPVKRTTTVAVVTGAGAKTASTSDVRVGIDRENSTPLPWQVPDENENLKQTKQEMVTYPTKHHEPEYPTKRGPPPDVRPVHETKHRGHSRQNTMQKPHSPPPPYEDHGRRNSVDEIIVLGATAQNAKRNQHHEKIRLRSPPAYQSPVPVSTVANRRHDPRGQNALESYTMAKQAAQLLHLDNNKGPNQPGYKKPKRLVFVAE